MVSSFSNFSFLGSVSVLLLLSCSGVHSRAVDDGQLGGGEPYPGVVGPGAWLGALFVLVHCNLSLDRIVMKHLKMKMPFQLKKTCK